VEIVGGEKEIREVKGDHLFKDINTSRKLAAGEVFCRARGMKFRVVTKSFVNPELWPPEGNVQIESPSPSAPPPLVSKAREPSGCLGLAAAVVAIAGLFVWLGIRGFP
jgi:hypothetical protein